MAEFTLPPNIMAALNQSATVITQAKNSTNPFETFAGPPGRYYARLRKVGINVDKKTGKPVFTFLCACLAKAPDATSASPIPDQQWAGRTMRITQRTQASTKQTEAEAWERAMQTMQAFGVRTQLFGMRDNVLNPELVISDMVMAIGQLNAKPPAVIIDVTESNSDGKVYKNCNPREPLAEEAVAQFATVTTTVDESEMEIPDEVDVSVPDANNLTPEQARDILKAYDAAQLRENMAAETAVAHLDLAMFSLEQLLEIGVSILCKQPLPAFASGGVRNSQTDSTLSSTVPQPSQTAPSVPSVSLAQSTVVSPAQSTVEQPPFSVEELDDEVDDEVDDTPTKPDAMTIQMEVASLDRTNLKRRILEAGGRTPEQPFRKSETDEALRTELFELLMGIRPKAITVPNTVQL